MTHHMPSAEHLAAPPLQPLMQATAQIVMNRLESESPWHIEGPKTFLEAPSLFRPLIESYSVKKSKHPQPLKEPAKYETAPSLPCCTVTAPVRVNHTALDN